MKHIVLPIEYLHERFELLEDGRLRWKRKPGDDPHTKRWNKRHAGAVAGTLKKNGYIYIVIDYRLYAAHRIVFAMAHGRWPKEEVDHINGRRSDNRISNLRECSRSENNWNQTRLKRHNTSGVHGVCWHKQHAKWHAQIRVDGKRIHLGYFENKATAKAARKSAEPKYHGEFASPL